MSISIRPIFLRLACVLLILSGCAQAASAAWIPAKAVLAQILLERAFAQSQQSDNPVRPWPWADMVPLSRISVARLDESAIVLSGASGQALAFGPTVIPTNPASGVIVLAAHRDTHFAFIRDLAVGDEISSETVEGTLSTYRIERFETVRWDRFTVPQNGHGDWLALATCFPFGSDESGPLRRIAWARKIAR